MIQNSRCGSVWKKPNFMDFLQLGECVSFKAFDMKFEAKMCSYVYYQFNMHTGVSNLLLGWVPRKG